MSADRGEDGDGATAVVHRKGCVRIRGEMTVQAALSLKADLCAALRRHRRTTLLDLSDVTEFDTAGLQILFMARRLAAEDGRALQLAAPSPVVREVLGLCRLTDWVKTPDEAAGR